MHWNGQCTCVGTIKKTPIRKITINDVQHIHIINRSNLCFCSIQIHNGIECLISKFVISFSQWRTFSEYMCMIMIPISKQHKNHLFYYLKKEMFFTRIISVGYCSGCGTISKLKFFTFNSFERRRRRRKLKQRC